MVIPETVAVGIGENRWGGTVGYLENWSNTFYRVVHRIIGVIIRFFRRRQLPQWYCMLPAIQVLLNRRFYCEILGPNDDNYPDMLHLNNCVYSLCAICLSFDYVLKY